MNTIATLLTPDTLTQLMRLATQAGAPAHLAVPTVLLDTACESCGVDLKVAPPVVGRIACVECAKDKTVGKPGRRYVKAHHALRTSASPQELARAGGIDLSNYSDGELGRVARNGLLGVAVTRMQARSEQPDLTPEQSRKVAALMETFSCTRQRAVALVTKDGQ